MKLYLDIISPKPKFILFDNNNLIKTLELLDKKKSKISDSIDIKYLELSNKYNFARKLSHLYICIGPASYTALRVGISFLLGLSYSLNIPLISFKYETFLKHYIKRNHYFNTVIFIFSSQNQNFIFYPKNKIKKYEIEKIRYDELMKNKKIFLYKNCLINTNLSRKILDKINKKFDNTKILECSDYFNFFKNNVKDNKKLIKPLYISDNKIFD